MRRCSSDSRTTSQTANGVCREGMPLTIRMRSAAERPKIQEPYLTIRTTNIVTTPTMNGIENVA
jgi:hypothetical protein